MPSSVRGGAAPSEDGSSVSGASSFVSTDTKDAIMDKDELEAVGNDGNNKGLETAIFGILFTLSKVC